ncbi:MAG: hypothetical protein RLY20_486 [Verrucomicrobiota bacterium]|jgi:hypothetical protein
MTRQPLELTAMESMLFRTFALLPPTVRLAFAEPYSIAWSKIGAAGGTRTGGVYLVSGTITGSSDRNVKENFRPVSPQEVLAKVVTLPITEWNYKADRTTLCHIGPMTQDFRATFGLGETDTGITTVDADGVALAAIQGLNQKLEVSSQKLEV